jgi:hypothetical protein
MRRNVLLGSCLAIALGTLGCQDQKLEPTAPPTGTGAEVRAQSADLERFGLNRGRLKLPSGRLSDQYLADAVRRVINPDDYECPPTTPVVAWFLGEVNEVIAQEPEIFDLLYNQLLADLVPTYEALLFQTTATPQYFGYNGEYTQVMLKTEKDVKRFWDIFSDDIQLIGMHGSMLLDVERVAATYQSFVFGVPPADAAFLASLVRDALLESQTLNGGNHPLFSFNAFAFSTDALPIPDKIVMGDGILAGYEALGFDDVAPQAIYAHEFAHHIQFENDYFDDPLATQGDPPERTRYTELMADAYSAYYLTHKRGAAMNRKRVEQFLQVFFQIGDCAFTNPGHHGTPNQRMAAARFAFDLAHQAQKQGHILTSGQFHDLFLAAYPGLVAPDAT